MHFFNKINNNDIFLENNNSARNASTQMKRTTKMPRVSTKLQN